MLDKRLYYSATQEGAMRARVTFLAMSLLCAAFRLPFAPAYQGEAGAWLRKAVLGYYQYHAVPGNSTQLRIFQRRVGWLWRTVLVRRSQRAQMRWDRLSPLLARRS